MKVYTVTRRTGEFLGQFIIECDEVSYGRSDGEYDLTTSEIHAIVMQHRLSGDVVEFLHVKPDGTISHLELIK
tara:strand:- start:644 stop:862 length:219 start_codon:yes stop_codon:yes gene_type:complete